MSARYVCPNDGEVLNLASDSSSGIESYQCAFCGYKSTKTKAATLKVVDETYVPTSRSTKPK